MCGLQVSAGINAGPMGGYLRGKLIQPTVNFRRKRLMLTNDPEAFGGPSRPLGGAGRFTVKESIWYSLDVLEALWNQMQSFKARPNIHAVVPIRHLVL